MADVQGESGENKVISKVQIFSSAGIISGSIAREKDQRLLDLLNTSASTTDIHESAFIYVTDVSVAGIDGKRDALPSVYVNKSNIFFMAETDSGVVNPNPGKVYPYVVKERIGIKFYVTSYELTGKIHYPKGHKPEDILTSHARFFPLTEARIHSVSGEADSEAGFIAVNKDQVLYIEAIS